MGHGTISHPVWRTWTVELRPRPDGLAITCPQCGPLPVDLGSEAARTAVVAHLAQHARSERLPPHLRTCQCGEQGCPWHGRHRGCDGSVVLLLARDWTGRTWRLTDACRACAAATEHAAAVVEPSVRGDADSADRSSSPATGEVHEGCDLAEEGLWWVDGPAHG
jgi:hypothetical protein